MAGVSGVNVPHLLVEYSANLDPEIQIRALVDHLHLATIATGAFAAGSVRTRAVKRDVFRVGNGDVDNAFVHLTMRVGQGESAATHRAAAEAIFSALVEQVKPLFHATPLVISAELQEIDPQFSFKKSNLLDRGSKAP